MSELPNLIRPHNLVQPLWMPTIYGSNKSQHTISITC